MTDEAAPSPPGGIVVISYPLIGDFVRTHTLIRILRARHPDTAGQQVRGPHVGRQSQLGREQHGEAGRSRRDGHVAEERKRYSGPRRDPVDGYNQRHRQTAPELGHRVEVIAHARRDPVSQRLAGSRRTVRLREVRTGTEAAAGSREQHGAYRLVRPQGLRAVSQIPQQRSREAVHFPRAVQAHGEHCSVSLADQGLVLHGGRLDG